MAKECIILDLPQQEIDYQSVQDGTFVEVEHEDGWYVRIPKSKIDQLLDLYSDVAIISPYSLLYVEYKRRREEGALWVYVHREHIYFATFLQGRLLSYQALRSSYDNDLESGIKAFLSDFYRGDESYFVERIEIFHSGGGFYEDPDLGDRLLLPVFFHQIEPEKVCSDLDLSRYLFPVGRRERSTVSLGINRRFVVGVGLGILLLLAAYDLYLRYQSHSYEEKIKEMISQQSQLANETNQYQSKILQIGIIKPIIVRIGDRNEVLESKLKSLFDLVPDDTYLTYFALYDHKLVIEGVSKSKKSFLDSLHRRLIEVYPKGEYKIKRERDGYHFKALYEEEK
ncbi:MAG: hypothetical protein GXO19_03715 [Epsilonproteobacteria bacterium]|nr:hypothetical protein [Campylobacterota bacterium]NPA56827.1 hypothetical protein [Campylobacterota bacterium]